MFTKTLVIYIFIFGFVTGNSVTIPLIKAFNGANCDGDGGSLMFANGDCYDFRGRQSVYISSLFQIF